MINIFFSNKKKRISQTRDNEKYFLSNKTEKIFETKDNENFLILIFLYVEENISYDLQQKWVLFRKRKFYA